MTKLDVPSLAELPTTRQLNLATLGAAAAAAVILVVAVLPAEYGIDPTGIGGVVGLTPMGLTKQAAAEGGIPTADAPVTVQMPDGSVMMKLVLRPYFGKEAKATMKAGGEMEWDWSTDGAKVEYEFHGDPAVKQGDEYSSYEKGDADSAKGTFRAPFDGIHGWYWKNNTNKPVTITARVKGDVEKFAVLGE